jgi:cellulose synthase (UDP-forming)
MTNGVLHALVLSAALFLLLPTLSPNSVAARIFGIAIVEFYTVRYALWRACDTLPPLTLTPTHLWQWTFFLVEVLAMAFTCWGTFVLCRFTDHSGLATVREKALREAPVQPKVAVFIATMSEPREVVEPAIRAAIAIEYPRFEVIVLDDDKGKSLDRVHSWLPTLCSECGAKYLRRTSSANAKVGNLNYGISQTDAEVFLFLDADFRVEANILWRTVGLLDEHVALVQTPQHYYSSDPIQHNLGGETAWTEDQRYFFDVYLPARDAWKNAVCVGTSFVVRRSALLPEGFITGCLSEDVYAGYELLSRGHKILYLNEPLSRGSAADSLPGYIRQRVRWAQGILQSIFLPHGPLRAKGLGLLDRLFYLEMPLYWISQYGFLGCVLLAPVVYFWTGVPVFMCSIDDVMSYMLPRIAAVSMVVYWISKGKVMPIVAEIQKLIGLAYILGGIFSLVVQPKGKPWVPTTTGVRHDNVKIHASILLPFLGLAASIWGGVLFNIVTNAGPVRLDEFLPGNIALALYVSLMLFWCCLVCVDQPRAKQVVARDQTLEGRWSQTVWTLLRLLLPTTFRTTIRRAVDGQRAMVDRKRF